MGSDMPIPLKKIGKYVEGEVGKRWHKLEQDFQQELEDAEELEESCYSESYRKGGCCSCLSFCTCCYICE